MQSGSWKMGRLQLGSRREGRVYLGERGGEGDLQISARVDST